jgi:hypothetical protein
MASKLFLKPFVTIPVDPTVTGIYSHQLLLLLLYRVTFTRRLHGTCHLKGTHATTKHSITTKLVHNTKHNINTPTVKHLSTRYLFNEINISGSLQNYYYLNEFNNSVMSHYTYHTWYAARLDPWPHFISTCNFATTTCKLIASE